jgi:hypothetical protein
MVSMMGAKCLLGLTPGMEGFIETIGIDIEVQCRRSSFISSRRRCHTSPKFMFEGS